MFQSLAIQAAGLGAGNDQFTKALWHFDDVDGSMTHPGVNDDAIGALVAHDLRMLGNAQIDTAQSQFGGSAMLFDGVVGSRATAPDSDDFFFGAGDWTMDFWVNSFDIASSNQTCYIQLQDGANFFRIYVQPSGATGRMVVELASAAENNFVLSGTFVLLENTWHHVAISVVGNSVMRLFIDGVLNTSLSMVGNVIPDLAIPLDIGQQPDGNAAMSGSLDEFRVSKGIARWVANFTPPSAAYGPNILRTGNDEFTVGLWQFDDVNASVVSPGIDGIGAGATGPHTWVFADNTQISTAQDRFGGSSVFFDGAGDYARVPASPDLNDWAGKDITLDVWIYPTIFNATASVIVFYSIDGATLMRGLILPSGQLEFVLVIGNVTAAQVLSGPGAVVLNQWQHITYSRDGDNFRLFIDGVLIDTTISATAFPTWTADPHLGTTVINSATWPFGGYMDEYRLTVGLARWTDTFTPPKTPYGPAVFGNDVATVGLWHFDDVDGSVTSPGIDDVSAGALTSHDWTFFGAAQIDTAQSRFGGSAIFFDGVAGTYATTPDSPDWAYGLGDFTIDFWFRPAVSGTNMGVINQNVAGTEWFRIFFDTGNNCSLEQISTTGGTNFIINAGLPFTVGVWAHYAFVRDGNTLRSFVDGVQTNTVDITGIAVEDLAAEQLLGMLFLNATWPMNGHLDELRLSKGIARWTKNFTPPTLAYGP